MVLQTKVFLIVALRDFSPFSSRRKTFIRRVKHAVHDVQTSFMGGKKVYQENTDPNESCVIDVSDGYLSEGEANLSSWDLLEGGSLSNQGEISQNDAMRVFTKVPFPEPKRVIRMRPRG